MVSLNEKLEFLLDGISYDPKFQHVVDAIRKDYANIAMQALSSSLNDFISKSEKEAYNKAIRDAKESVECTDYMTDEGTSEELSKLFKS